MDQGIVSAVKANYRKLLSDKILGYMNLPVENLIRNGNLKVNYEGNDLLNKNKSS